MVGLTATAVFILEVMFNSFIYVFSRKITVAFVLRIFYQASIFSSVIHLISLSAERSIAILLPLRYNSIVGETFIKVLWGITWLIALIVCVIYITVGLIFNSLTNVNVFFCNICNDCYKYAVFYHFIQSVGNGPENNHDSKREKTNLIRTTIDSQ